MSEIEIRYVRDQVASMAACPKNALSAYGYRAQGAISVGRDRYPQLSDVWDALEELVTVAWRERMLRGNDASGQGRRKAEVYEARRRVDGALSGCSFVG